MDIQYIWVADNQYLSREFEYTDKYGQKHCYVVADEAINAVVDENDDIDIGIYGYVPIQFLFETLFMDDQKFAEALNKEYFDMEL